MPDVALTRGGPSGRATRHREPEVLGAGEDRKSPQH